MLSFGMPICSKSQLQYKGAESIINKAIEAVLNYAHYAQLACISDDWAKKILEEIKYGIEQVNE